MMVPFWVVELAEVFWRDAGAREPFPRSLRGPIARALPVAVISLPRLRLEDVRAWLQENGPGCRCGEPDRPLRACLFAWRGWGYVFLDGGDPEDEQRFSLAHELAHFLKHYWQPRREAARRLGEPVLEVLDGRRPPTPAERLLALLSHAPVGYHVHLMQRGPDGGPATEAVRAAEEEADRLACELLAPAGEVLARLGAGGAPAPARCPPAERVAAVARVVALLQEQFGLPAAQAVRYGDVLLPAPASDPLLRRLGLAP